MLLKRVVVTGLGAVTPLGNTVDAYWQSLLKGVSGADYITKFNATKFRTTFACEIKGFDPLNYLEKGQLRRMDLFSHYAIAASDEAIAQAQLQQETLDKDRIGVIWCSGIGGLNTLEEGVKSYLASGGTSNPRFSPFFVPKMILDIASGHISMRNGYRGLNFSVVSACASSTNGLIDAFNYIRLGKADAIVVGGSEAAVTEAGIGGFAAMRALSTRNDDPQTASRPFDTGRDGFVLGEGAGAIILEEYEHAIKRGVPIYAEMIGGGLSADAYHLTKPHPEGLGATKVMQNALEDAQITASEINYINVHGTSTPLGDLSEAKAIQKVFGEAAYQMNISSTKSMTGHLLGATGAIEAIACIKAIQEDIVPPTINHFEIDAELDKNLNFTFNKAQKRTVNAALSNTFGFGGHNASVIFKKIVG